jgi:hypothetical protein
LLLKEAQGELEYSKAEQEKLSDKVEEVKEVNKYLEGKLRRIAENYRLLIKRIESMFGRAKAVVLDREQMIEEIQMILVHMQDFSSNIVNKQMLPPVGYKPKPLFTPPRRLSQTS